MHHHVQQQHLTFRKPRYDPGMSDLPYHVISMDFPKAKTMYSNVPGFQYLDQIVPAPKRLREKFNYQQLADVQIWNETPDLYELSNELVHYFNKEEVILNIRNRCLDRGIRCQMPYGVKNETKSNSN